MDVWPYSPDWRTKPVNLTLTYDTFIVKSRAGVEHRIATRLEPRMHVSYEVLHTDAMALALRESLKTHLRDDVALPLWHQGLIANFQNDNLAIDGTANRWLGKDTTAYISDGYNGAQIAVDHLLTTNTDIKEVVLPDGDTLPDWALNIVSKGMPIMIYPTIPARFADRGRYTAQTSRATDGQIAFDDIPGTYTAPILPAPLYPMLNDKEVFDFPVDWTKAPDITWQSNRQSIDNGKGAPWVHYPEGYASEIKKVQLTLFNKDEIQAFIDFFIRQQGKLGSFYFPSQEKDFDVVSVIGAAVNLQGIDAGQLFRPPSPAVGLSFLSRDHYLANRPETGVVRRMPYYHSLVLPSAPTSNDPVSSVNMTNTAPPLFDLTSADRVSMLYLARFATDRLRVSYKTSEHATIEVAIEVIFPVPPEIRVNNE